METPNTRGRSKREMESVSMTPEDQGASVRWAHDTRLRKFLIQASENTPCELPMPTQKPCFSLRSPSTVPRASGASSSSTSTGSARPRKRPCRATRSLPSALIESVSGASSAAGPSSAPATGRSNGSGSGLDSLLRQAMETFSIGFEGNTPRRKSPAKGKGKYLGEGLESPRSPLARSDGLHRQRGATILPKNKDAGLEPGKGGEVFDMVADGPSSETSRQTASQAERARSAAHVPRMGMGMRRHASASSTTTSGPKAFRPPLLAQQHQQPTRSSPRRALVPATPIAATPLRDSIGASPSLRRGQSRGTAVPLIGTPLRPKRSAAIGVATATTGLPSAPIASAIALPPPMPEPAIDQHPSSDGVGTGDESFDSLDGMFMAGGADVEELWRKVDGTQ